MNFACSNSRGTRKLMSAGDVVIIYERHDTISYIQLEAYGYFENKFGLFYHNHFIGKPFGTKIYSKTKSGWLYALEPTPELWSLAM
jgi:tRNA (adenine57-N1/adenine58-N1)-methyltransferase catalytic subunit